MSRTDKGEEQTTGRTGVAETESTEPAHDPLCGECSGSLIAQRRFAYRVHACSHLLCASCANQRWPRGGASCCNVCQAPRTLPLLVAYSEVLDGSYTALGMYMA